MKDETRQRGVETRQRGVACFLWAMFQVGSINLDEGDRMAKEIGPYCTAEWEELTMDFRG